VVTEKVNKKKKKRLSSILPTNSGEGFEGLGLNLGWNCAPTKYE
jgi:hypothetical protein